METGPGRYGAVEWMGGTGWVVGGELARWIGWDWREEDAYTLGLTT